jgi:hypothetical protein
MRKMPVEGFRVALCMLVELESNDLEAPFSIKRRAHRIKSIFVNDTVIYRMSVIVADAA